jgi:hypothetical protein
MRDVEKARRPSTSIFQAMIGLLEPIGRFVEIAVAADRVDTTEMRDVEKAGRPSTSILRS